MIYENSVFLKKIGKKRLQGKILLQKTLSKVLFFVCFNFFMKKIYFLSLDTTDSIISNLKT